MRTLRIIVLMQVMQVVISLVNLSVNKSADMSTSQYSDKWLADEAVDGDVSQDVQDNSCAVTLYGFTPEAWWRVDLGAVYVINSVKIYNRRESPSITYRLSGFSLFVSASSNWQDGVLCYRDNNGFQSNPGPSDVLTVPCNATGRYVTLYKQRYGICVSVSQPHFCTQFELCEVQIFGCENGTYGALCGNNCSVNCFNEDVCNKSHGGCEHGCTAGYRGFRCDNVCNPGSFGFKCSSACGHCSNSSCNNIDGSCPHGCSAGWKGFYCNETCNSGFFGVKCSSTCGNCLNSSCNNVDGSCPNGCIAGWKGFYCSEICLPGFYGQNCSTACSTCSEFCHYQTGECLVVERDTKCSDNDKNEGTIIIILIVAIVLMAIALAIAIALIFRNVKESTRKTPTQQTQEGYFVPNRLSANFNLGSATVRETSNQLEMVSGSNRNDDNTAYEELQMNITDTNTYEKLKM